MSSSSSHPGSGVGVRSGVGVISRSRSGSGSVSRSGSELWLGSDILTAGQIMALVNLISVSSTSSHPGFGAGVVLQLLNQQKVKTKKHEKKRTNEIRS